MENGRPADNSYYTSFYNNRYKQHVESLDSKTYVLDSNNIQARSTKRKDSMVWESITTMELYTLGNSRMGISHKDGGMNCKRIKLTHSSKLNMMMMKRRLKKTKSPKDKRWFEITSLQKFALVALIDVFHNLSKSSKR